MSAAATKSPRYMPVAEVAKHLRAELKATFPATKFSVRSRNYAGGASIDIQWENGPTRPRVDAIAEHYAGATFDGMQDLKESKGATMIGGELVHSLADFVFTERHLSDAGWALVAAEVGLALHVPVPARQDADRHYPVIGGRQSFAVYVRMASNDRTYLRQFFHLLPAGMPADLVAPLRLMK